MLYTFHFFPFNCRRRKQKGDRTVIIPEEAFRMDEECLPHLKEVKIQEEPYPLQDGLSVSYESEYTKFKFSMGDRKSVV